MKKKRVPWNKGLTKETDERLMKLSKKITGRKLSEEHKKNVSLASKFRNLSVESIRKRSETKKKPRDEKWYNTICSFCNKKFHKKPSHIGKYNFCNNKCQNEWQKEYFKGENGSGWIDGRSFEKYGLEFNKGLKRKIRQRDKYTCQECGCIRNELCVHHIDYNKQNNSYSNLISLCNSCHTKTNWKREDWEVYFKNKIKNIE